MNKAVWLAKRNYWIAAVGAIVSLISFFTVNFLDISVSFSLPNLGLGTPPALPSPSLSVNALSLALSEGILWVSLALVLVVLGVAIVFLVRRNPVGSRASVQAQARWTALGFVVAGVLGIVCLVASILLIQQHVQDIVQNVSGTGLGSDLPDLFHFNLTWGVGAYLFLGSLVAIVVAGLMEVIWPMKLQSDAEMATIASSPQNGYDYLPPTYRQTSMNQSAPHAPTQYGGSPASGGSAYPTIPGQQPPPGPYQQ